MLALTSSPARMLALLTAFVAFLAAAVASVPAIAGDDVGPLADGEKLELAGGSTAGSAAPESPVLPAAAGRVKHVANVPGTTGGHVAVEGDRLYVGAYGMGMRIFSIEDPAEPTEIGAWIPGPQSSIEFIDPGVRADAVPDAALWDGRHIVALGGTGRTSGTTQTEFIDASDPSDLQLLWRFTGSADGEAHNSDIVDERRLWLPSGGAKGNGLRIYDMRPLLDERPRAPEELFRGNPGELWKASPFRGDREVGPVFTHTHDVQVYTDHPVAVPTGADHGTGGGKGRTEAPRPATRYELRDIVLLAEGGRYLADGDTGSIFVIDITDPANPVVLNRWMHDHPDGMKGGHHPIRYFHEVQFLDADPSVMIVTDEDLHNGCGAGGVTILRASPDLTEAKELSEWFIGDTATPAAVCSSHVFSTRGHHMFMGSYNAGLQIIDLTNPAEPTKAAQHIPPGANSWGALAHNNYVYVGDFGARGLDVFEFTAEGD